MAEEAERAAGGQRREHAGRVAFEREGDRPPGRSRRSCRPRRRGRRRRREVDHVDDGDDPEHGQRVGEPAELEAADERQRQVVDADAGEDRDQSPRRPGRAASAAPAGRRRRRPRRPRRSPRRRAGSSGSRRRPGSQIQPATSIRDEDRQARRGAASAGRAGRAPWAGRSRRSGRRAARRREPAARRSRRRRGRRGRRRLSSGPWRVPDGKRAELRLLDALDSPEGAVDQQLRVARVADPDRGARACAAARLGRVVEDAAGARRRSAPRRRRPCGRVKVVKTGVPSATASRFIVPPALTTRSA